MFYINGDKYFYVVYLSLYVTIPVELKLWELKFIY